MSDQKEVAQVTESIDGAIMEELASPEEIIDEPDISFVYDGEIEEYDLTEEEEEEEKEPEGEEPSGETEVVETEEVSDEETDSEASLDDDEAVTPEEGAQADESESASLEESETEREPFSIRVDRQEYDVPDAYVEGDNIVIPREAFQRSVQPMLADRNVWRQERSELLQTIEDLDPQKNPDVVKANAFLEKVNEVFEDEESAYAFFKDFNANRDKLVLDAERAALDAEKKQFQSTASRKQASEQAEELAGQMETALDSVLEEAKTIEAYANVDMEYIRDLIEPVKAQFFFRAAEDLPKFGLKEGEIGVRIDLIEQFIQKEAKRSKARMESERARQRNRAQIGDSPEGEEPAPPASIDTSTPDGSQKQPEITSREEWEAHLAGVAAGR